MIKNNEREQLESLTPADVPILISLPNMSSGDFDKVPQAIPVGEAAARALAPQLARMSVSREEYAQWRRRVAEAAATAPHSATIANVRIVGVERANPDVLAKSIHSRTGEALDQAKVVEDAQRLFARGDFEGVDYRVEDTDAGVDLTFLPKEKSWGPDYLRFDIGLMSSLGSDTGYLLRADHARSWVNSRGARWSNTLQLGRTALAQTALFQPLSVGQSVFVEPQLSWSRELQDLYRQDDRVARYQLSAFDARIDGGVSLGNWGEVRLGLRRVRSDFIADTGDRLLPEFNNVKGAGVTTGFELDTRDSPFIPTRGAHVRFDYFGARSRLGSDDSYDRAELFAQQVIPVRRDLLYLQLSAGSDLNSDAPAYDLFTAGGAGQVAGFESEELRGREYAFGRIAYLWKVTDLQTLLGQALYTGVSLEAGNMYERIDDSSANGLILGSSLFFGGRTPLGPLVVSFGYAEGGHKAAYVQLGRPLQER